MTRALPILALWLAGCAHHARFVDQPVVWRVDDQRPIETPREREYYAYSYLGNVLGMRPLIRASQLPDHESARNTNALDEVPDSSWFTNRIGVRELTPEQVARGPVVDGPPVPPLVVKSGKSGGGNPGFVAKDSTGRTFIIKFDRADNFEMQTANSVIVNRALWAAGWHVPEDTLVTFARSELQVGPEATRKTDLGKKLPLVDADLDAMLATVPRAADGRFRASASLYLPGQPVGGFSQVGTRADDPNDLVPHQHRRELRGLRAVAAWLSHTDMKDDNTLDVMVDGEGGKYIRHYLLDFGEALGGHQAEKDRLEDGFEYAFDWAANGQALLSFGIWRRPWEDQELTPWPVVGAFGAEAFEPEGWKEAYPYRPFRMADATDLYWGAKLVMRFDRPMVEAMVHEGRISDPDAEAWLVDALMARREKVGHAWLEALSPFDQLTIGPDGLCGVDLGVYYGLAGDGVLERLPDKYRPDFDDRKDLAIESVRVAADGTVCLPIPDHGDYTVDRLRIRRGRERKAIMQVHYKGGDDPRILGVIRMEP